MKKYIDNGVSPVVGIAVLVAVAVVMSALVFAATSGFVTEQQAPSAGANVNIVSESVIEVQLDSVQNADKVYVQSPLGTRYELESVGDTEEILNIGNQQKPVVIAEKDGKEHVVQGITPRSFDADVVVAKDGSGDSPSLQDAIDSAESGETIVVKQGTYNSSIDVTKENLNVISENGTEINGDFTVQSSKSTVSNFSVNGSMVIKGNENNIYSNSIESTVTDEGSMNSIVQDTNKLIENINTSVNTNSQPLAEFSFSPKSPKTGDTVTFDGSDSSDPDGDDLTYSWDFDGDGQEDATGEVVSNSFENGGTYDVVLSITDGEYSISSSSQIEVVEPLSVFEGFESGTYTNSLYDDSNSAVAPKITSNHAYSGDYGLALPSHPGTSSTNIVKTNETFSGNLKIQYKLKKYNDNGNENGWGFSLQSVSEEKYLSVSGSGWFGGVRIKEQDSSGSINTWGVASEIPEDQWKRISLEIVDSDTVKLSVGDSSKTVNTNYDWTSEEVRIRLHNSAWGNGDDLDVAIDDIKIEKSG